MNFMTQVKVIEHFQHHGWLHYAPSRSISSPQTEPVFWQRSVAMSFVCAWYSYKGNYTVWYWSSFSFYCCETFYYVNIPQFIHFFPIERQLNCFQFGLLWTRLLWTSLHMPLEDIRIFLGSILRSWIAGSYSRCMFSLSRCCQCLNVALPIYAPTDNVYKSSTVPWAWHYLVLSILLIMAMCIAICHCGLTLLFPED